ncbi:predicted protein [Histoplasma capsulatum H143]|uniref:Uncharacterized protein n=1 Tax=Ajellomyces capsulatus (strain H143) TaxID=544712 RepID=C6H3M2_AJECH|nr:predicted protein [Histoplasma capsulatum H143]
MRILLYARHPHTRHPVDARRPLRPFIPTPVAHYAHGPLRPPVEPLRPWSHYARRPLRPWPITPVDHYARRPLRPWSHYARGPLRPSTITPVEPLRPSTITPVAHQPYPPAIPIRPMESTDEWLKIEFG